MPKPHLQYLPLYVAVVTETDLGDSGRNIKAHNDFLPSEAGEIRPALDGLLKLPPPAVDEKVLVLQLDATNQYRYYLPIRSAFSNLTDDSTAIQAETTGPLQVYADGDGEITAGGDLTLEGTAINIGSGASEWVVKGDTLKQQLTDLITQITAITVTGNMGAPSGPPLNAAAITALSTLLVNILSTKVKVE